MSDNEFALLNAAYDLRHANKVYMRTTTPEESAKHDTPGRILVILIGPSETWARSESFVPETTIADPTMHQGVLDSAQKMLDSGFETLSELAKGRSLAGEYKQARPTRE